MCLLIILTSALDLRLVFSASDGDPLVKLNSPSCYENVIYIFLKYAN